MIQRIKTSKAPAAIGPYSQGSIIGNLVFTSGQIGINPKTGDLVALEKRYTVHFKPSKELKKRVNNK